MMILSTSCWPSFCRRASLSTLLVVCRAKRLIVFTLEPYIRQHHRVERRKAVNDYKRCSNKWWWLLKSFIELKLRSLKCFEATVHRNCRKIKHIERRTSEKSYTREIRTQRKTTLCWNKCTSTLQLYRSIKPFFPVEFFFFFFVVPFNVEEPFCFFFALYNILNETPWRS